MRQTTSLTDFIHKNSIDADAFLAKCQTATTLTNPHFGAVDDSFRDFSLRVLNLFKSQFETSGRFGVLVSKTNSGLMLTTSFKAEPIGLTSSITIEDKTFELTEASSLIGWTSDYKFNKTSKEIFLSPLKEDTQISIYDFSHSLFEGKPKKASRGGAAGLSLTINHWMTALLDAVNEPLPGALLSIREVDWCAQPIFYTELWVGKAPSHLTLKEGTSVTPITTNKPIVDFLLRSSSVEADPRLTNPYWIKLKPKIIFDSKDEVVILKPSGLLSVPGIAKLADAKTLTEKELNLATGSLTPVHRLDMDTSGLIVYAKNELSTKSLMKQFRERTVEKIYIARVKGTPTQRKGHVSLPITTHPTDRLRQIIAIGGRPSVTEFEVANTFDINGVTHSDLLMTPVTGRTHQLRIHAAHPLGLNTPILGDPYYSEAGLQAEKPDCPMMLHAFKLSFDSLSGTRLSFIENPSWI